MSNYQYPWEEIFQDCADLITVQIRDGKKCSGDLSAVVSAF